MMPVSTFPCTDLKLLTVSVLCSHKQVYVTSHICAPYACLLPKLISPDSIDCRCVSTCLCRIIIHDSMLRSACACTRRVLGKRPVTLVLCTSTGFCMIASLTTTNAVGDA